MEILAVYHDCCLPDYFQGSPAEEVLAVPVTATTTYYDALEALKEEWRGSSGYFDRYAEEYDLEAMGYEALRMMFAAACDGTRTMTDVADFTKYIEDGDEDSESVYLYVGMMEVKPA